MRLKAENSSLSAEAFEAHTVSYQRTACEAHARADTRSLQAPSCSRPSQFTGASASLCNVADSLRPVPPSVDDAVAAVKSGIS